MNKAESIEVIMLRKFLFVLTDETELEELEKFSNALGTYYPILKKICYMLKM